MMSHLEEAFQYDIRIRLYDDRASPEGVVIVAADVEEGVVFSKAGLMVTVFEVDHRPIKPALGYRIDYGGRAVALSGDTRFSENLIRHAQGVDVLIHEVVVPESLMRAGVAVERAKVIVDHHTTPQQAGQVFARVRPRLAVYSHIVFPSATTEELIQATRETYAGPLEVGEDLTVITAGEKVDVQHASVGR